VDLFELVQNQLGFFLLIVVRISGMFITAPVFGSHNVPGQVKVALALLVSYILFPAVFQLNVTLPDAFVPYMMLLISEFLVGLILGFASSFVFSAVQMTGNLLDMQIGFGIVNILDPMSGQQVPLVGNFKYILAILTFLAVNGHHILLSALFASFKLIPVTGVVFHAELADVIVDMVSGMFVIALKISLPILAAILLTDVALGVLARTMPQMNIFVVGVPVKILVGIFVLSMALPFYIIFLEVVFNGMYHDIYRLLSHLS
jgi:flagellar biosynthetic protein FliR